VCVREREREENFFARGKGSVFEQTNTTCDKEKKSARSKKVSSSSEGGENGVSIPTFAPTGGCADLSLLFPPFFLSLSLDGGKRTRRSRRARRGGHRIVGIADASRRSAQRERRETILRNGRGEIIQTQHPDGVANRKRKVETRKRESRRRKRRRTLILYAKYRFSTILLWTFGLFKSRSICVRVRLLLAVCSSSSSSSEAKMRAVRSRSSIREVELVVVACPPPSSPDLFFRPRRRKPAMIDSSLCSSRRRREEGEASHE
jgi:hypothetical protein